MLFEGGEAMNPMDEVIKGWLQHRMVVHDLLDLVDDEHINFKPWDDAYSLADLAIHIARSMGTFVKMVKSGEFSPLKDEINYQSIADVREIVKRYTDITKQDMKGIYKFQLNAEVEFNHINAPGSYWLSNAMDHEIHHKGQLFTYVRMIGVEKVPFFMKLPSEV